MSEPDWKNFAKAVLTDWPTGDLDGSVLFDLSLQYGMLQEVPGGYNSDHHIDAEGICPEEGDPWYEYSFRGEAGPGLYSIAEMNNRIKELEADVKAVLRREHDANKKALEHLRRAEKAEICSKNYAAFNREWRKRAEAAKAKLEKAVYAMEFWKQAQEPDIDTAIKLMNATLAELKGQGDG